MNALFNLITEVRTCIAKLQTSSLNGFIKGKHLARLNARLRKLYKQVAAIYNCKTGNFFDDAQELVNLMMHDEVTASIVIGFVHRHI